MDIYDHLRGDDTEDEVSGDIGTWWASLDAPVSQTPMLTTPLPMMPTYYGPETPAQYQARMQQMSDQAKGFNSHGRYDNIFGVGVGLGIQPTIGTPNSAPVANAIRTSVAKGNDVAAWAGASGPEGPLAEIRVRDAAQAAQAAAQAASNALTSYVREVLMQQQSDQGIVTDLYRQAVTLTRQNEDLTKQLAAAKAAGTGGGQNASSANISNSPAATGASAGRAKLRRPLPRPPGSMIRGDDLLGADNFLEQKTLGVPRWAIGLGLAGVGAYLYSRKK